MAGSSLIPGILDHIGSSLIPGIVNRIVLDEIMPLMPWHTRPLLMALSRPWTIALNKIGVQDGNRLDPIGERVARVTRLKQPLQCRLAAEYYRIPRHSRNVPGEPEPKPGYMVKLFDGQWRNVAPISGSAPPPHTSSTAGHVLGVVDGSLYFGERLPGSIPTIRIIALDVGSGLWQWKEVCRRENNRDLLLYICRSSRVAGNLYVYRICHRGNDLHSYLDIKDSYLDIAEIPAWEQITDWAPTEDHITYSPRPIFVHVGNRLYFFGAHSYTESVSFFDLNTRAWNNSIVEAHLRGNLHIVEKNVLLVAYNYTNFHILRYDLTKTNERWIRAGWMLPPADRVFKWTWCVEYDDLGEKQLWIYICSHRGGVDFNLCKWQVVQRLQEGGLIRKVWDDIVLPDGEVECELVNRTPLDQPIEQVEPISVRTLHGFHRSDSTNFQDIPALMCPIT